MDYFILTEFGGDNTCQSTNVKSCVQNNSTRVIDHNYINTGRTFNRSERLDSYDNEDKNCSLDYFISTEIGGDNTYCWEKGVAVLVASPNARRNRTCCNM